MVGPVLIVPAAGRALVLGDWGAGSALRYGELAGLVGPRVRRGRAAFVVTDMLVDHPASRAGGRAIWGVPKELATFEREEGACTVRDPSGAVLLRARWPAPRLRVPLPASGWFAGLAEPPARRARLAGRVVVGPVVARLEVPATSPLAALRIAGRRPALAGSARLRAGAPRVWG